MFSDLLHVEQSLPICCTLAAIGGILEVGATAVTAVPAVRQTEGVPLSLWVQLSALAGNLALQALGSLLSHLVAPWYGPVSMVVPFFYSSTLLSNMLIFGVLLGTEFFTKTTRVGSYVIVVAVILLPLVGPGIQQDQDLMYLFHQWYTIAWFGFLLLAMMTTCTLLLWKGGIQRYKEVGKFAILLIARASAISVNLTVSKAFVLSPSKLMLAWFVALKLISGCIYTYAIVVQATAVDQARFVPLNTICIILVNALTGILIWQDGNVVQSWYGYACVFVLLGLGCDLLLTGVPLLNPDNPLFGTNRRASLILHPHHEANLRGSMALSLVSSQLGSTSISHDERRRRKMSASTPPGQHHEGYQSINSTSTPNHESHSRHSGHNVVTHDPLGDDLMEELGLSSLSFAPQNSFEESVTPSTSRPNSSRISETTAESHDRTHSSDIAHESGHHVTRREAWRQVLLSSIVVLRMDSRERLSTV